MKIQQTFHELWSNPWIRIAAQSLFIIIYFLVGCGFYYVYEGWSGYTTCFFTVVTICTVGYGYHTPTNDSSRAFTIFYIIIGVYCTFSALVDTVKTLLDAASAYVQQVSGDGTLEHRYLHHQRVFWAVLISIVVSIFICGGVMASIEDWTFITGLYFAVQTSSTVGYGELTLKHGSQSKPFVSFYMIISITLTVVLVKNYETLRKIKRSLMQKEDVLLRRREMQFLADLDKGDGISEEQFIIAILTHIGTVNREKDILPWIEKFRALNQVHKGKVKSKELESFAVTEAELASRELDKISTTSGRLVEEGNPLANQGISLLHRDKNDDPEI